MSDASDLRARARDDRDRAVGDRRGDEILAVDRRAGEGTENGPRRDLAVVEGEAGYLARGIGAAQRGPRRHEVAQPHSFSGTTRPRICETSISWSRSGAMPSAGAMRGTILAMLGAVTWPAVE